MTYLPYHIDGADRSGRWLVTCDHAANTVPQAIAGGDLGLHPVDMERHIAYDVGAAGVARALGSLLDSPAILSNFSRLHSFDMIAAWQYKQLLLLLLVVKQHTFPDWLPAMPC